jgi:acetylornithine deacetylase/succinyl-diaminopimelate desuccinylase-like protein
VVTGQRGLVEAEVVFTSGTVDLHSGRFGGAVPNPAVELARLVAALHDGNGRVAVPGFYDDVRPASDVERADFARLPFDEAAWLAGPGAGVTAAAGEAGWSSLERTWVRPTAEVNGFISGYTGPGVKTIIPHRASVKLSFRLVPDQHADRIRELVRAFVTAQTPDTVHAEIRFGGASEPYAAPTDHPATWAIRDALHLAFDQEVRFNRAGGSGPAAALHTGLDVPTVYFGVGLPDDRIHAPNERVVLPFLLHGAEALAYLWRRLPNRMATTKEGGGGSE